MRHGKKQYGFTCPDCGQPLTQDMVLFGLPYSKEGKLYLNEKELVRHLKRQRDYDRAMIKMGWKEIMGYLSNTNNLNCPELKKLKFDDANDADKIKKGFSGKTKQVYRRICNRITEKRAKELLLDIAGLFSGKEKKLFLEATQERDEKRLVELHVYDGKSGEDKGKVSRSCSRCKQEIFKRAGAARHSTVVFIEPKERKKNHPDILGMIWDYLPKYQGPENLNWSADFIEPKKRISSQPHLSSLTVEIECGNERRLLTLALASNAYRDKHSTDEVCYFPDADAYVLYEAELAENGADVQGIQRYAQLLQSKHDKVKKKNGYVPMLLLYGEEGQGEQEGNEDAIFPADRVRAQGLDKARAYSQTLHKNMKNGVFYAQLFFGTQESSCRIADAVSWILQVTGCIPIQIQTEVSDYRVIPPVCESVLATEQFQWWMLDYWKKDCFKLAMSEMKARSYLFDNAKKRDDYQSSQNWEQLEDCEKRGKTEAKKSGDRNNANDSCETPQSMMVKTAVKSEWEEAQELIQKCKDGAQKDSPTNDKVVTFLIGNGFDRGMGLKSGYDDFYKLYLTQGSGFHPGDKKNKKFEDKGLVEVLRDAEDNQKKDWADYEIALGAHSKKTCYEDENARARLMGQNDNFQAMFYAYLKEREEKMIFAMKASKKKTKRLEKVKEQMEHALESFYAAENIKESHEKVANILQYTWGHKRRRRYQFVCFNYSSVLDNCVKQIKDPKAEDIKVHHVHGELNESSTTKVMGVNDEGQMGNAFAYSDEDICRLHKWRMMKRNGHQKQYETGVEMIWESDVIVLYGVSLGETDKVWWQIIYQWLLENSDRHLIIYEYGVKNGAANPVQEQKNYKLKTFREMTWGSDVSCPCADSMNEGACEKTDCVKYQDCEKWSKINKDQIHFAIGEEVHKNMFMMDLRINPKEDDGKTA